MFESAVRKVSLLGGGVDPMSDTLDLFFFIFEPQYVASQELAL